MKKASKIIIGSSLAAAVLIGGGAYAATSIFGGSNVDLSASAPENASVYAEIDLNPSLNQKVASLALSEKIDSMTDEDDFKDKNLIEAFTEDDFPGLDYEKDIKPWIGAQTANVNFNDKLDNVNVYEIKDKKKAEAVLNNAKTEKRVYQVADDWVVVAKNSKTLEAYNKSLEGGTTLSDLKNFKDDKKAMGDNVAFAWVNLAEVDTDEVSTGKNSGLTPKQSENPEISGRMAASLSLSDNSVNLDAKTFALTVDGVDSWETTKSGSTVLAGMSDSAVAAVEIVDVSNSFKKNWEEVKKQAGAEVGDLDSMQASVEESIGVKIPDEIEKIIGNNLAIVMNKNESIEVRADGADASTWQKIYDLATTGFSAEKEMMGDATNPSDKIKLSTDGSVQKFIYSENLSEEVSKGKLSDTLTFKDALPDLNKAQIAGYLDIKEMMDIAEKNDTKEDNGVDEGVVGVTVSYDEKSKQHDMKLRWVLR